MQQVTSLYRQLFSSPHRVETKVVINGTEYNEESDIIKCEITRSLFSGSPDTMTGCAGSSLSLQIIPKGETIPKMAQISVYCRLSDSSRHSEWIPQGVFFIDVRRKVLTPDGSEWYWDIQAYDCILKLEQLYFEKASTGWPKTMSDCADDIASLIGTTVDSRSNVSQVFVVQPDSTLTMRDYLSYIALVHGGVWASTPTGEIRLIVIFDPSDATSIGYNLSSLDVGRILDPYTGVIVSYEDEDGESKSYTAGVVEAPGVGSVLEVHFPWATQAIANYLLSVVQGYVYCPFTAKGAKLDPAAELGDSLSAGAVDSVIVTQKNIFCGTESYEVSAGSSEEVDHEFKYESPIQRSIKNLDRITAQLKVETERISLEVSGKIDGTTAQSLIDQTIDAITLSVTSGDDGSFISLTSRGVTIESEAVDLNVKAANISGTLTIGQLPNTVAQIDDIPTDNSELTNGAGYKTESGVVSIINGTVDADYVKALNIAAHDIFDLSETLQLTLQSVSARLSLLMGYKPINNINDAMFGIQADIVDGNVKEYLFGAPVLSSSALGGGQWRIILNPGNKDLYLYGPIMFDNRSFGSTDPTAPPGMSGEYGQVYFQIPS